MKIVEAVGNMAISSLEAVSQYTLGNLLIRAMDRSLAIVEKTAQWSLPEGERTAENNGKTFESSSKLERPLPWVLFLPSLMILRGARFVWNVAAFILRFSPLQPSDIVRSTQNARRRLRLIRLQNMKKNRRSRNSKDKNQRLNDAKRSLLITLSSLSCLDASLMNCSTPVTKIHLHENREIEVLPADEESNIPVKDPKRKHDQVDSDDDNDYSDDDVPLTDRLTKYAEMNSSEDSTYIPENTSSTSDSMSDNADESTEEIRDELMDIYRAENSQMSEKELEETFDQWLAKQKASTDGNANCTVIQTDNKESFSPCRGAEEAELEFYSPMSSKNSSPERDQVVKIPANVDNQVEQFIALEKHDTAITMATRTEDSQTTSTSDSTAIKNKSPRQNHKGKRNNNNCNRKRKY